jgi:hypothetical protein
MNKALITVSLLTWFQLKGMAQIESLELGPVHQKENIKTESIYRYRSIKDSSLYRHTVYDTLGKELESTYYDRKGQVESYTRHTYDNIGNMIRYVSVSSNGDTTFHFIYTYDDKGRIIEYNQLDTNGVALVTQQKKYNKMGLVAELITGNPFGKFYVSEKMSYDKKGRLIKSQGFDDDRKPTGTSYDIYNSDNKRIQVDWEDEDGRRLSVTYTYDSLGNCINRKYHRVENVQENGAWVKKPWLLTEKLTYYPNGLLLEYTKYRDSSILVYEKHFYNR